MNRHGAAVLVVAALVPGCSSSSPSGPGPSPTPGIRCRDYATRFAVTRETRPTGIAGNGAVDCLFNRAAATLRCTTELTYSNGCVTRETSSRIYASVSGFVAEYVPVGRVQAVRLESTTEFRGGCAGGSFQNTVWAYDAQGRVQRQTETSNTARRDTVFSAWDGSGRPLNGMLTDLGFCVNVPVLGAYDDVNRTWAYGVEPLATLCGWRDTKIMDSQRNVIFESRIEGAPSAETVTVYTVIATAQVCI